jgi:dTDP-4-dehydrorhamnose reductase
MRPKILLFGRNGQVGSAAYTLLSTFGDLTAPARDEADISDAGKIHDLVRAARPSIIVNAAAYTGVDKAETEREIAFAVNRDAPRAMAQAAKVASALLIHYSTDYVFSGDRPANAAGYVESDATGPLSAYGESKLAGEHAIEEEGCDHVILRTAWVYAARGQNFVRTIRRLARERESLRVVSDQFGTPTWAWDIAGVTAAIIRRYLEDGRLSPRLGGLFHMTSAGRTTWHDFAKTIISAERQRGEQVSTKAIEPIATREYPTPAHRPSFSVLDCNRLREVHGLEIASWRERFQAFLDSEKI